MLYNLNLHNVICQLYFNKIGAKEIHGSGDLFAEVGMASVLESYTLVVSFCSAAFRCCDLDQMFTFF